MKKALVMMSLFLLATIWTGSAFSADCVLHVKRIACAGQEAESYKKCDGKQECDVTVDAATTEEMCLQEAKNACENKRLDITKYKVITATFKGKALVGEFNEEGKADAAGLNFCDAARPDLNQCK